MQPPPASVADDVVEIAAAPKAPPTVVHVDKTDAATALNNARAVIKEQTQNKNEALLSAWALQKQLKRDLVATMGVGDQIFLPDGSQYVKERKRNRDLNADALVEHMASRPITEDELRRMAETKRLPDTIRCDLIEAGFTYREVLLRVPAAKRIKVKLEPQAPAESESESESESEPEPR